MYNRVRHRNVTVPELSRWTRTTQRDRIGDNVYCTPLHTHTYTPISTLLPSVIRDETISDVTLKHPPIKRRQRVKNSKIPRPCKPVNHVVKKITPVLEPFLYQLQSSGSGVCDLVTTRLDMMSPAAWACERFGYDWIVDYLKSTTPDISGYSFTRPDWFSVVDSFNEEVESLFSSSFFGFEDMKESGIYADAFRLILHPRRQVTHFFKEVVERGLHRKTLGEIHHAFRGSKTRDWLAQYTSSHDANAILSMSKEVVNANLLYKFGVRPAITDIISTFDAHAKVNEKLAYLSANAGQYVPIRVRRKLPVSFDASFTPTPYVDIVRRQSKQLSVVSMFAQGRVREDIQQASKWRAYLEYFGLNKVIGTAWELIPFSFVVDWFTNAQERINDLTRVRLGESPFYNLVGVGSSVRDVVGFEYLITPGYDTTYGMNETSYTDPVIAFQAEVSNYTRTPGLPDTSGVVDVSTLGLFHGITGGELLLQRIL